MDLTILEELSLQEVTMDEVTEEALLADDRPLTIWQLSETESGYKYILTMIDYFTKYVALYSLKDKTGHSVDICIKSFCTKYALRSYSYYMKFVLFSKVLPTSFF